MNITRKLLCILLMLAVLLSVAVPALAAEEESFTGSLTLYVEDNIERVPRTFGAVRILDLSVVTDDNGEPVSYLYTVPNEWRTFFANYFEIDETAEDFDNRVVSKIVEVNEYGDFLEFCFDMVYASDKTTYGFERDGEDYSVRDLPLGLYVMFSTCGLCGQKCPHGYEILNTATPDRVVPLREDVSGRPSYTLSLDMDNDLTTTDDRSSTAVAAIGDMVTYVIEERIPHMCGREKYYYIMNAILTNGLTYPYNVDITIGDKILEAGVDYEVESYEVGNGDTKMTLIFKNFIQYSALEYADATMTVSYNAILNSEAETGSCANINEVDVEHSSYDCEKCEDSDVPAEFGCCTSMTAPKYAEIYSGALEIVVTDALNNRLTGSEFTLYGENKKVVRKVTNSYEVSETGTYWKLKNGSYTEVSPDAVIDGVSVDPNNYESVTTKYEKKEMITTDGVSTEEPVLATVGDDGILRFEGLDEGTYQIYEIVPPAGYTTLGEEIEITVTLNEKTGKLEYEGALTENNLGKVTVIHQKGEEVPSQKPVDDNLVIKHSLNLAESISMNYIVPVECLEGYDPDTIEMIVDVPVYDGNTYVGQNTAYMLPEQRGDYYYFVYADLTAVHMNDILTATLCGVKDGVEYQSPADLYSVAAYAMSQMNKETATKELKILCADLLRYGAKAQVYKNYRTDAPADGMLTDEQRAYLTDLDKVTYSNQYLEIENENEPAFRWIGKGLDLESKVGITFLMAQTDSSAGDDWKVYIRYRKTDGTQAVYIVDKEQCIEGNYEGQPSYKFTFSEFMAAELRNVVCLTVYNGAGEAVSNDLIYSADTYGNGKTGALGDVCKALFAYSDSAKVFFTK